MIAAIYARKSSDDSDRNEEARSTARQIAHATEYARARGWTVEPHHVYIDDAVSGAEWARRHGLNRLLAVVDTGRPPFGALIVSELSRIGRDTVRVPYVVQRIEEAGVEIHGCLSGQRISVDDEMGEMQTMLHSLAASYERRRAKQRTHDALLRRARAGHVANGVCFGYRNVPVLDAAGRRQHSARVIDPAEAAVVVRIFTACAEGAGYNKIARRLNDEGAPAPAPRRAGRRHSWSTSTVRDVLNREMYRGRLIWNQRRRDVRQGKRTARRRPESEWVTRDLPELRIISEKLWQAAHERLAASRAVYLASTGGVAYGGRPTSGLESPYLLTGLLSCGACLGSMFAHRHGHQEREFFSYLCTQYHTRGRAICKNGLEAAMMEADAAVLTSVERDVLKVEVLETALFKALAAVQAPQGHDEAQVGLLRAELAKLETEIARLAGAIAEGGDLRALLEAMRQREARRVHLVAEIGGRDREAAVRRDAGTVTHALDVMRQALTDWRGMLRGEIPAARRAFRALLAGRLRFTPQEREGERFYAFEGPGTISPIIVGALPKAFASPP